MKKQDFIKAVASSAGLSQDVVSRTLTSMIETVTSELQGGNDVNITGFGAFKISKRAARK
jgi:DNA-binding protein HU-beta